MRLRKIVARLAAGAIGVALFLFALRLAAGPALESPNRMQCARQLRSLGQAMLLYANETRGSTADSFATLMRTQDLVPEIYICPSDRDATRAIDAARFDADDPADCSYVYVGDRLPGPYAAVPADALIAFDRDDNHGRDGVNALFGDGHVEFLPFAPAGKPPAWWRDVQEQIARGVRPVLLPAAATQAAR